MEALASKTAIARRVEKAIRKGLPTVLADKMARKAGRLKSGDLSEAVAAKDLVALKEVQRAAHFLGVGLGSLINALGPEIVIVGGGVAGALGEPYLDLVRSAARAQAITDPEGKIRIEQAALGDDAGILGAALLRASNSRIDESDRDFMASRVANGRGSIVLIDADDDVVAAAGDGEERPLRPERPVTFQLVVRRECVASHPHTRRA